ncbi:NAD(P)-binding domain-containing protein [Bacillus licheniformis]|nr:NAD(P)-binding domain-containing protein [Bacillus licheniformis]
MVGGYESAMDAAVQLASYGSDVTVVMPNSLRETLKPIRAGRFHLTHGSV